MRTRIAAAALILAAARAAALGPATEWQDVPPETTLSNAVMAAGVSRVAWSGDYNDLTNKPAIPAPAPQVQSDWDEADGSSPAFIRNKPTIPTRLGELEDDVGYATASDVEALGETVQYIGWNVENIDDIHYTVRGERVALGGEFDMSPLKEVYVLGADAQGRDVFPAVGADRKEDALYVSTNRNTLYRYDAPAGEFRPIVIDESAVMGGGHTIEGIAGTAASAAGIADYVDHQMNDSESGALVRIEALEEAAARGIPAATTSTAGIVKLSNAVTNDESMAATPKAVMDATALTERTGFTAWTLSPEALETEHWYIKRNELDGKWELYNSDDIKEGSVSAPSDATSLVFYIDEVVTATRTALSGYRLGPDSEGNPNRYKFIASETEAEALRAALAQKADAADAILKSGGTMDLGSVLLASHLGVKGGEMGDLVEPRWTSYGRQGIYVGRGVGYSSAWTLRFPEKSGVLAITNDIPDVSLSGETLTVDGWSTNVVTRYSNGAVDIGRRKANTTVGQSSSVLGFDGTASASHSCAEGYSVTASGFCSHAEGYYANASGNYSHAEGNGIAHGDGSHAEGNGIAVGYKSHAEGMATTTGGQYSHAAGFRAVTAQSGFSLSPINPHDMAWCWQGHTNTTDTTTARPYYHSHGHGTFNINPVNGIEGFWIGETNFTQHVRNIAAEVSPPAPAAQPKRVAMFVIPVNEGGSSTYKGFELKCSTNNFASAASESVKLQFYSQSEIADTGSGPTSGSLGIDKMKLFACTSYWSARDRRSYSPIGNTIDYGNDLYSVVALVDVSCLKRHPEDNGAWLSEDNEDLVWCYMRDTANDVEREQLTMEPLWRPIAPVKWFRELPSWAR